MSKIAIALFGFVMLCGSAVGAAQVFKQPEHRSVQVENVMGPHTMVSDTAHFAEAH